MHQLEKNKEYWFVLGAKSVNRETRICEDMRHQKMQCFVPMKYEVKRVRNIKQETLVPAIRGLIFARGTEDALKEYMLKSKDGLFFRRTALMGDPEHWDKLIVADKAMDQFMKFVTENEQNVQFFSPEEITWVEGESVSVTIGSKVYEGEIVRIKGRKKFALQLKGAICATVQLTPELMSTVSGKQSSVSGKQSSVSGKQLKVRERPKSKDVEGDKKLLTESACKLLFELADQRWEKQREYQVTEKEVERVMIRLSSYKGVTAALEGELALAMFLGSKALKVNEEQATERIRTALTNLQDSSMLKLRMRFYLAKLTGDETELKTIQATIKGWNHQKPQRKQQELLNELHHLL